MPLFLLMGELLFRTRLADDMFRGLSPWVARLPGGLLHVNIIGCGILAAIVGSSGVCAATIGRMSIPELKRQGYDERMMIGDSHGFRHAGHPHSAVDHDDRVRDCRPGVDRASVHRPA